MRNLRRPFALVALAAALSVPLGVAASHGFTDVPTSNTFHADIDAIADVGVTTGCAAGKYCPKDFVTREQMAAFMNRLGALGPGKTPVVNADKLDGKDGSQFAAVTDIVTMQSGPWQVINGSSCVTYPDWGETIVACQASGSQMVGLSLQTPAFAGGRAYGLKSLEVCFAASAGVAPAISRTLVEEAVPGGYYISIDDQTDYNLNAAHCYTVTDPAPEAVLGAVNVKLGMVYPQALEAHLGAVTVTWTPIAP